jgi:hypothetical protein
MRIGGVIEGRRHMSSMLSVSSAFASLGYDIQVQERKAMPVVGLGRATPGRYFWTFWQRGFIVPCG